MGAFPCQEFVQFDENGKETRNSVYHRIKTMTGLDVEAKSVRVRSWEFVFSLNRDVACSAEFSASGANYLIDFETETVTLRIREKISESF